MIDPGGSREGEATSSRKEIEARIAQTYPYPIAVPFWRLVTSRAPAERGDSLLRAYEATVRHLALVAAADLLGGEDPGRSEQARLRATLERPHGMGAWLEVIRAARATLHTQDHPFGAEVIKAVSADSRQRSLLGDYEGVVRARNQLVKKSDRTPNDHQWRKLVREWEGPLLSWLVSLEPVLCGRLVFYAAEEIIPPRITYSRDDLVGCSGRFRWRQEIHNTQLPTGRPLWLSARGDRFCDLGEFLVFAECDRCDQEHLYTFKTAAHGNWEFADSLTGHTYGKKAGTVEAHGFPPGGPIHHGGQARTSDIDVEFVETSLGPIHTLFPIGRGRYGTVALARIGDTSHLCVLKVLEETRTLSSRERGRFQREVDSLRLIDHPNVIRLLGTTSINDMRAIVLEYCAGGDLDARFQGSQPLGAAEALSLMTDIAEGLKALHARGLIHRDIKPSNILMDDTGRGKIGDLGLARSTDSAMTTGTPGDPAGTRGFMPPEVLRGAPWTQAGDVYSLGLVFMRVLIAAGVAWPEKPGETPVTSLVQELDEGSEEMDPEGTTRRARDLLSRMLSDEPEGRPSIDQVLEALGKSNPEALRLAEEARAKSAIVAIFTEDEALALLLENFPAVDPRWLRYFLQVGIGHRLPSVQRGEAGRRTAEIRALLENRKDELRYVRYAIRDYTTEGHCFESWRSPDGRIAVAISQEEPDESDSAFERPFSEPWVPDVDLPDALRRRAVKHALINPCGVNLGRLTLVTDPDSLAGEVVLEDDDLVPALHAPWSLHPKMQDEIFSAARIRARRPFEWDAQVIPVSVCAEMPEIGDYRLLAGEAESGSPKSRIMLAVAGDISRFEPESAGSVVLWFDQALDGLIACMAKEGIRSVEVPLWLDLVCPDVMEVAIDQMDGGILDYFLAFLRSLNRAAESAPKGSVVCLHRGTVPRSSFLNESEETPGPPAMLGDLLARLASDVGSGPGSE